MTQATIPKKWKRTRITTTEGEGGRSYLVTLTMQKCYPYVIDHLIIFMSILCICSNRFSSRHRKRPHFFSFNEEVERVVAAGEGFAEVPSTINQTLEFDECPVVATTQQTKKTDANESILSMQEQVTPQRKRCIVITCEVSSLAPIGDDHCPIK